MRRKKYVPKGTIHMKTCKFCGKENLDAARFCAVCGSGFTEEAPQTEPLAEDTQTENIPMEEKPKSDASTAFTSDEMGSTAEDTNTANAGAPSSNSARWSVADEGLTPPSGNQTLPPSNEKEFYERCVPTRMRNNVRSLAIWLWICAGVSSVYSILSLGTLSLLLVAADVVLGIFLFQYKRWAAIAGMAYSATVFALMLVLSLAFDGIADLQAFWSWGVMFALFLGAFRTLGEMQKAYETYRTTGVNPFDTPAEREREARAQKHAKRNAIIVGIFVGALAIVTVVAGVMMALENNNRYESLDGGTWEENVYSNAFYEFSFACPEGFTRLTDEEVSAENEEYYGGDNIRKYGGKLFEVYNDEIYDDASVYAAAIVVRQDYDDFTSEEMLSYWLEDDAESAELYGYTYESSEVTEKTVAGKTYAYATESYVIPWSYDDSYYYTEDIYNYVYQEGEYTLWIVVYVYDDALEDAGVEALLENFTVYTAIITESVVD